jgi:hypothetical protein
MLEQDVTELICIALNIKTSKKFNDFENFRKKLVAWARDAIISVESYRLKHILIRILELKVNYSWWYKVFVISKARKDVLSNWNDEGKYIFYIDECTNLLEALRFNLRNKTKS